MANQKAALRSPLVEKKWPPPAAPPAPATEKQPQSFAKGNSSGGDRGPAGGGGGGWTFLEALFPFEYKNDQDRHVRMVIGDRYRLFDRSNEEWWQVIPLSVPESLIGERESVSQDVLLKHSFYVPAKYVQELREPPSPANSLDRFCGDIRPSHRRQGSTGTLSSATPDWRDDSGASNDGLEAAAVLPVGPAPERRSKTAESPQESPQVLRASLLPHGGGGGGGGPTPGQKPAVSAAFLANLEGKIGSFKCTDQGGARSVMKTSSVPSVARGPPSPPATKKPQLGGSANDDQDECIYANIPPAWVISGAPQRGYELPCLKQIGREAEESSKDRPIISAPVLERQSAEKRGHLAKTKVKENSKRVKKSWTQHYVLLRGPCLYFFRDQKAPKSGQPHGRPEFTLPLETVHPVPVENDLTNRKHVIGLEDRGAPGSSVVYYLQCEDAVRKNEWTLAIKMAKELANRKGGDLLTQDTSQFASSPKRRSFRRKAGSSDPSSSGLSADAADKQKVIWLLVDFFRKRQPAESLQAKGILRNEPVFGSTLADLAEAEKNEGVPNFVVHCIDAIEARGGLTTQGIYRVNGNGATIQRLRCLVDQTSDYDLMDSQWELEVLTGALKLFFRELKEPLIPCAFYDKFVSVVGVKDKSRLSSTKKLLNSLPPIHLKTMKHLFHHLDRVVQHCSDNQMHPRNVAIVFGPNLLWPAMKSAPSNSEGLTATVMWQNQIVEFILNDARELFGLPPPLPQRAAATESGTRR